MARKPTEVRREEIKLAVLQIIRNEGIKSVSTKNLAKYTGLSEGAIFRHFKSKREIMLSIIDDVDKDMIDYLQEISLENISAKKRLYKAICKAITYLTKNNGITILLFTEASQANDSEMIKILNNLFNSQIQVISKIIKDGIDEGIWNKDISVEDVATLYMGIPITHNIRLVLTKKKPDNNFCKRMMQLFERMLK